MAVPADGRLLCRQAAKCRESIAKYLAGQKDMGISSQYVSGSAGASLFGSNPVGSLVFFAPTDAAWERAAIRLSARRVADDTSRRESLEQRILMARNLRTHRCSLTT